MTETPTSRLSVSDPVATATRRSNYRVLFIIVQTILASLFVLAFFSDVSVNFAVLLAATSTAVSAFYIALRA